MKETIINIPSGTRYLSEVISELPYNAYINKGVTGCGGTTLALTNEQPYVVAVHSKAMVENKVSQHSKVMGVTGDVSDEQIFESLLKNTKKYIVTYDSLPRLCKFINPANFHLLVDEVQVLIRYAGVFKIKVCNELLLRTLKFKTVSYMTATPTPTKYLPKSLQDLEYVEYKWEDAVKPIVRHKYISSNFNTHVLSFILDKFNNTNTDIFIFFNSTSCVSNTIEKLLQIIPNYTINDINVFFAENTKNNIFKKVFGKDFRYAKPVLSTHKRINFVSSMGFEGIDFYNKDVSILVASNAKYKSMRYDISIDIPQIVGRFRNLPTCPIDFIWATYTDEATMSLDEFELSILKRSNEVNAMITDINTTDNNMMDYSLRQLIVNSNIPYAYIDDDDNVFRSYDNISKNIKSHKKALGKIKINEYAYCSLMSSYFAMHCDYHVLKNENFDTNDIGVIRKATDIFNLDDTLLIKKLPVDVCKQLNIQYNFVDLAKEYCQHYNNDVSELLEYSNVLRKYHNVLSPETIATHNYCIKSLDMVYKNKLLTQDIGYNPLLLTTNSVFSITELLEKLSLFYNEIGVVKEPSTRDLKQWYVTKPSTIRKNNVTVAAIKIIGII